MKHFNDNYSPFYCENIDLKKSLLELKNLKQEDENFGKKLEKITECKIDEKDKLQKVNEEILKENEYLKQLIYDMEIERNAFYNEKAEDDRKLRLLKYHISELEEKLEAKEEEINKIKEKDKKNFYYVENNSPEKKNIMSRFNKTILFADLINSILTKNNVSNELGSKVKIIDYRLKNKEKTEKNNKIVHKELRKLINYKNL